MKLISNEETISDEMKYQKTRIEKKVRIKNLDSFQASSFYLPEASYHKIEGSVKEKYGVFSLSL